MRRSGRDGELSTSHVEQELPRLLVRSMATLPAVWVLVGLAMAMFGLLPRFAMAVSWGAVALFGVLELAWEMQQVSQSVFNLPPFAHVHWISQATATPWIWLTGLAAALAVVGLAGFLRRDAG